MHLECRFDSTRRYPLNGCVPGSVVLTGKPRRIPDVRRAADYPMSESRHPLPELMRTGLARASG